MSNQLKTLIARVPVDPLRPHANFQSSLLARTNISSSELTSLEKILNNGIKSKYALSNKILRPAFNKDYYERIQSVMEGREKKGPLTFITKYFRWK